MTDQGTMCKIEKKAKVKSPILTTFLRMPLFFPFLNFTQKIRVEI